jgi:protein-disulfide isomerase
MDKLHLTILSFACCNPKLAPYDQQYAERLKEAAAKAEVDYDIDLVHATEARMSPKYTYLHEIMPLLNKYGSSVTPALFINGHLSLYGGVPALEKLVEVLEKAKVAVEQGRL